MVIAKLSLIIFKNLSEIIEEKDFMHQLKSGRQSAIGVLDRILYGDRE